MGQETAARRSLRPSRPVPTSDAGGVSSPVIVLPRTRRGFGNAEAGPSTPARMSSHSHDTLQEMATPAGAGSSAEAGSTGRSGRRVLPARIRRAAGGGQEGIRDLEEMIVDWLERWGLPSDTPPESLPIHLTTIPLHLVHPPTTSTEPPRPQPVITLTPTHKKPGAPIPSPRCADNILDAGKIETPGWVIVRPGDDDAEEAREEMESRRHITSPLKRLRRLAPEEGGEDTSDAFYLSLHKKFEVFERRQRIREKEKLVFERYKMRSRIELLRNMSEASWATVVNTVLSRDGEASWEKGRVVLDERGVDWLRERLVKEGKELMKRYDQLLPTESRKPQVRAGSPAASTLTSERTFESSPRLSSSPAPAFPARVTALRDGQSQKKPRNSTSPRESLKHATATATVPATKRPSKEEMISEYDDPSILLPRKRKRVADPKLVKNYTQTTLSFAKIAQKTEPSDPYAEGLQILEPPGRTSATAHPHVNGIFGHSPSRLPSSSDAAKDANLGSLATQPTSPVVTPSPGRTSAPDSSDSYQSPPTKSSIPCLLEAASRREAAIQEAEAAKARLEARAAASQGSGKVSRLKAREKTRTSGRLGLVLPFGLPIPPVLDRKSEFTITNEEDFWGIIADREARANMERRNSMMSQSVDLISRVSAGVKAEGEEGVLSKDDLADMKAVEAAVVL